MSISVVAQSVGVSALVALLSASPVAAEPAPSAAADEVALRYVAPSECPHEAVFIDAVNQRVRRTVAWTGSTDAVRMAVTIERAGERTIGKLEVETRAAETTRREFTAATCEEVSSALALVAALTLDPNARTEPLPPRAAPASQSDFPITPPAAAEVAPAVPVAPPLPVVVQPSPAPAAARPMPPYSIWFGPTATVANGYAPKPLVSFGFALGARVLEGSTSPGIQLSGLWGKTGTTSPAAANGSFGWSLGRLELCWFRFALHPRVALEPCAIAEAGRLVARGADSDVIQPVTAERWWLAAGAGLDFHVRLGVFFIRFGGLGVLPATRDEFIFRNPERTVHQASPFIYGARLGFGFQLGQ